MEAWGKRGAVPLQKGPARGDRECTFLLWVTKKKVRTGIESGRKGRVRNEKGKSNEVLNKKGEGRVF